MDTLYKVVQQSLFILNDLGYVLEGQAFSCVARQVTMLLICDWHNKNQNAKRLNARVEEMFPNDVNYENILRNIQRASEKLRKENRRMQLEHGIKPDDPRNIFRAKSKRDGIPISDANFQTILNFTNQSPLSGLMSDIEKRRTLDVKKVGVTNFVERFIEYENWVTAQRQYKTEEEFLSRTVNFFCLQEKMHIDLIAQIATYMDINNISEFDINRGKVFWGTGYIKEDGRESRLEANQVLFYNQAIPFVFSDVQEEYDRAKEKCLLCRKAQAYAKEMVSSTGVLNQLTISDAAQFIKKDYNVLEDRTRVDFGTIDNPKTRRIRFARKVMQKMWQPKENEMKQ